MQAKVFKCPALHFTVFRMADGSLAWRGIYEGTAIKAVVPIDDDCVIMLDPDANRERVFRNLLRIGCDGRPRWRAELPADPDVFLDVHPEQGALAVQTWSGFALRLDPDSGRYLAQEFVK